MAYYLKIINVFFLSTVKYFYTPFYANMIGLDYWGTMISMILGGVIGFLVYYHFSKIVILSTKHLTPIIIIDLGINVDYERKIKKYLQNETEGLLNLVRIMECTA